MAQDDLDHIPSIVPTRDGEVQPGTSKSRRARSAGKKGAGRPTSASGAGSAGVWARLFITLALVVAAVACAWAWQLQAQLAASQGASQEVLGGYAKRIAELEDRLADTDEGRSQNTASIAVKIREVGEKADRNFSEIDKLWASAWRKNRDKIAALEKTSGGYKGKIAGSQKSIASMEKQIEGAGADIAKLKSVAGDLERLMNSARSNQAEVERVADELNRINLEFSKLGKRVEGNEEWLDSINAFRKQINAAIADLNSSVRALQSAP